LLARSPFTQSCILDIMSAEEIAELKFPLRLTPRNEQQPLLQQCKLTKSG